MPPDKQKKNIRQAVALEYNPSQGAPKVVAAGKGHVAERIIESALENAVPVHEDPQLAQALNMLNIGDEIPAQLYDVVAQVLIYVADLDGKMKR